MGGKNEKSGRGGQRRKERKEGEEKKIKIYCTLTTGAMAFFAFYCMEKLKSIFLTSGTIEKNFW